VAGRRDADGKALARDERDDLRLDLDATTFCLDDVARARADTNLT
jgi:hypothetical protein